MWICPLFLNQHPHQIQISAPGCAEQNLIKTPRAPLLQKVANRFIMPAHTRIVDNAFAVAPKRYLPTYLTIKVTERCLATTLSSPAQNTAGALPLKTAAGIIINLLAL